MDEIPIYSTIKAKHNEYRVGDIVKYEGPFGLEYFICLEFDHVALTYAALFKRIPEKTAKQHYMLMYENKINAINIF